MCTEEEGNGVSVNAIRGISWVIREKERERDGERKGAWPTI